MPPATASAPSATGADLHAAYLDYLARTGRGNTAYWQAARAFFRRWPDPQRWAEEPLAARLSAGVGDPADHHVPDAAPGAATRAMTICWNASCPAIWREIKDSPLGADLDRFMAAAAELGFTERVRFATGSQVPARLLIQTGRRLDQLTVADLDDVHRGLPRPARAHRQGPPALPGGGQQHPAGAVPPRDRRPAAPLGRPGPVRRTAGRGAAADPRRR